MTSSNGIPGELAARLKEIGQADIVVGIPSFNNARTIGHVVRACIGGLAKYFPGHKSLLVNSDGGSKDGTREAVLAAETKPESLLLVSHTNSPVERISAPYTGLPGKGSAFRMIFAVAKELQAKACLVVDSDLRSIAPHWIELLAHPVLERGMDFVAPYYQRHKYDGTITNSIIFPITHAVFGKHVRQPIGGDFGVSGRLAARYLEKDVWESDVARFGVDIWMTVTAVAEGFRVGQSYLGAKLHDAKDPGGDLTAMFRQVVGSFFGLMETYESYWKQVQQAEQVPLFGFPFEVGVEPIQVNVERMMRAYVQGVADLREIYESFLTPGSLDALRGVAALPAAEFRLPDTLWVHVIYEFAAAYHHRKIARDHLMQALVPIYLGRTASFVLEMKESSAIEVEERLNALCEEYARRKPYLAECWDRKTGAVEAAKEPVKEAQHAGTG